MLFFFIMVFGLRSLLQRCPTILSRFPRISLQTDIRLAARAPKLLRSKRHTLERNMDSEGHAPFHTTHWSAVLLAGREDDPRSSDALERLCRAYWHPIYAFVRRRGHSPDTARELVQGFFFDLLRRKGLERADPARGRFRTFLLTSLSRFLVNEWDRGQRLKRGGGIEFVSLEAQEDEERCLVEPAHDHTPDRVFLQRWAQTVVARVVARLEDEYAVAGHPQRFERLKPLLLGDVPGLSYAQVAQQLQQTVPAVTSMLHRMRLRFREVFRDEIAQTVADPSEVDDEIRFLLAALTL
jgi:RNA polymerase sigma-70 factor (ECF subfamily)